MPQPIKRPPDSPLEKQPSAARLAAEAAFEPPRHAEGATTPQVSFKSRNPNPAQEAPRPSEVQAQALSKPVRASRTFRVEVAPKEPAASFVDRPPAVLDEVSTPSAGRRKRRRNPPADVTIIRPQETLPVHMSEAVPAVDQGQDRPAPDGMTSHHLARRLAAINAQIAELEREARKAKRAESARAIRWIKRAIAEYDLTADDLGV